MVNVGCVPHGLKRVFQTRNVVTAHVNNRISTSGNCSGIDDVRNALKKAPQFVRSNSAAAEQLDIRFRLESLHGRVHVNSKTADDTVSHEAIHTTFYC